MVLIFDTERRIDCDNLTWVFLFCKIFINHFFCDNDLGRLIDPAFNLINSCFLLFQQRELSSKHNNIAKRHTFLGCIGQYIFNILKTISSRSGSPIYGGYFFVGSRHTHADKFRSYDAVVIRGCQVGSAT